MKKLFLLIFVGMFLITLVSAQSCDSSSFIFSQNEIVNQSFYCYDSNNNLCTSGNIGVVNIFKGGTAYASNTTMTYNSTDWRYVLPTSELGEYSVLFSFLGPSSSGTGEFTYVITKSGTCLKPGESALYFLLLLVNIFLVGLFAYGAIKIPYSNEYNQRGEMTRVTKSKYLKIVCLWLTYAALLGVLLLFSSIITNFVSLDTTKNIVNRFYLFVNIFQWPVNLVIGFWLLVETWRDILFNKEIKRFGKALGSGRFG